MNTNDFLEKESEELAKELDAVYADARAIFIERHKRYGAKNISRAREVGVVVRMGDKLSRLETRYLENGTVIDPENDWLDLCNYSLIGLLLQRGKWPK